MFRPRSVSAAPGEAHAEENVFQRRESWEKMVNLEDVADVFVAENIARSFGKGSDVDRTLLRIRPHSGRRGGGVVGEDDLSAVGRQNARDHVQQRGLA